MADLGGIATRVLTWLGSQSFTPAIRELTQDASLPPAAYPQVAVIVDEERFTPGADDVTARLRLRVKNAAGRRADSLAGVRGLARQLRLGLHASHNLGGSVKYLRTLGIVYDVQAAPGNMVVSSAELSLEAKYVQQG